MTHPLAGTLYYIAARGNRLTILESLGYAAAMSTLWEFLGEFREKVSINDMLVTPISGLAIGESTTQLGAFFDRGCATGVNRFFGALFGPSKSVHDALDGAEPARDDVCDRFGFTRKDSHRFELWGGVAAVWQDVHGAPVDELRWGAELSVAHLPEGRTQKTRWLSFSDGNVASIDGRVALDSTYVSDMRIGAHVLPAGLRYRGPLDPRRPTQETLIGLLVGTEYGFHRSVRPAGPLDRIFLIDALASRLGYALRGSAVTFELSLDGGVTFAGVSGFAVGRSIDPDRDLASVTRVQGYSHTLGFALAPRARLTLDGAELGADARADRFFAVRVLDAKRPAHGMTPVYESRRRGELWLTLGPRSGVPRVTFFVDSYDRSGTSGEKTVGIHEFGCGARLGAQF